MLRNKHLTPSHLQVKEVMSTPVFSCFQDENVKMSLTTMGKHHVRRLPVVDRQGHLQGVMSIDDIVRAPHRRGAPTPSDIVDAFKAICAPRALEVVVA